MKFTYAKAFGVKITNYGGYAYDSNFSSGGRLYVIYNNSTNRKVYIGTTSDVEKRFKNRLRGLREFGFSQSELNAILIMVIKLEKREMSNSNFNPSPPSDKGLINVNCSNVKLDVEKLLIATYMNKLGITLVRNTTKTLGFRNDFTQKLIWSLIDETGRNLFGNGVKEVTYSLNSGELLP
ncbi:MAG: hypothetical protein ABJ383_13430 [Balneola sp.]